MIIWCGGEDVDFPNGAPTIQTGAGYFRSQYSRCSLYTMNSAQCASNPFPSGALTSAWLSFTLYQNFLGNSPQHAFGFGLSGTSKGLFLGTALGILQLGTWDGVTYTNLATDTTNSLQTISVIHRLNMQVINFGATATVNVYVDGALAMNFNGNVALSGMANFDRVVLASSRGDITANWCVSEIVVANEDTRQFTGLMTLALTGAGTTDQWTGVYSTINPITLSDATPNYTNAAAQDQQFNVTDLAAGIYGIRAVKIAARSVASVGSTATKVAFGYNSGGTVAVGTAQTLTNAYATYEQLDNVNPVTGLPFAQSDMNGLQLDARSS